MVTRNFLKQVLFAVLLVLGKSSISAAAPPMPPACFAGFTQKQDMLPLLKQYFQQPEFAYSTARYEYWTKECYGIALPFFYPAVVIDRDDYYKTVNDFTATYGDDFEGGNHIAKIHVKPGSRIIKIGDLHGNIQAFSRLICKLMRDGILDAQLNIINKDKDYIVFLGDFVDYGRNGADTLAVAMKLRIQNRQNVFLCRGNHEDAIHVEPQEASFNFGRELQARYGVKDAKNLKAVIHIAYDCMPAALFIGIEGNPAAGFIQCCHGGLGYDIEPEIQQLLQTPGISHVNLGGVKKGESLRWGDFTGHALAEGHMYIEKRGELFGITGAHGVMEYLARLNIKAVFRGHQDLGHACKNLLTGIREPICLVPHDSNDIIDLMDDPYETWIASNVSTLEALNNHWFVLGKLPEFMAPVFTFTNASSAKMNYDEGYGTLEVGGTWEESRVKFYIFRPEIFQVRACVVDEGVNLKDYCPEGTPERITRDLLSPSGFGRIVANMALLLPHHTYIDAGGNPQIYLQEPDYFSRIITYEEPDPVTRKIVASPMLYGRAFRRLKGVGATHFNVFYDQFKKPDAIPGAGIDPEFERRIKAVVPAAIGSGVMVSGGTDRADGLVPRVVSPITVPPPGGEAVNDGTGASDARAEQRHVPVAPVLGNQHDDSLLGVSPGEDGFFEYSSDEDDFDHDDALPFAVEAQA